MKKSILLLTISLGLVSLFQQPTLYAMEIEEGEGEVAYEQVADSVSAQHSDLGVSDLGVLEPLPRELISYEILPYLTDDDLLNMGRVSKKLLNSVKKCFNWFHKETIISRDDLKQLDLLRKRFIFFM